MQADRRGVEAGRDEAREVSRTLTRVAIAALIVALILAAVMYRLISRPILAAVAEIRDAAVAIGQGERNLRLPVRNRDELGLLAVVFNRMTARLRRGEERVTQDRLALETTIADRTADLRAVNDRLSTIDASRRRFFADVSHRIRHIVLRHLRPLLRARRGGDANATSGTGANVSGHGIGLSLVGWVVDRHGGTVRLRTADAPLNGAEISIALPLARVS